jgi:hypothetical protein
MINQRIPMRAPLDKPQPDITRFMRVVRGELIPPKPPLVELFLDVEIVRAMVEEGMNFS